MGTTSPTRTSIAASRPSPPPPSRTSTASRPIKVDFGGGKPTVYSPTAKGGIPLSQAVRTDPNTRLGYDLQARANGYIPSQIKPGSAADRRVITDLGTTLNRWQAQPTGSGKGGIATGVSAFRAEAAQTVAMRKAAVVPALRDTPIISATGMAQTPIATGSKVLRTNPILEAQWRSTVSPVTNNAGFSGPLRAALKANGINQAIPIAGKPASGTTSNSSAARTHNGDAARDAIADNLRASPRFSNVRTEVSVKTSFGERKVDVVAIEKGPHPELNKRIEIESKLGKASLSTGKNGATTQIAKDAERLAENARIRGWGTTLKTVGKVARPVGIALDAIQLGQAYQKDGNRIGANTQRAAGALAGGAAGAWGGAQAGAALGSLAGPVGTVVGGIVGGIAGGVVGSGLGEKAVGWIKSFF